VEQLAQVRQEELARELALAGGEREQQGYSRHQAVLGLEGLLEERSRPVVLVEVPGKRAC